MYTTASYQYSPGKRDKLTLTSYLWEETHPSKINTPFWIAAYFPRCFLSKRWYNKTWTLSVVNSVRLVQELPVSNKFCSLHTASTYLPTAPLIFRAKLPHCTQLRRGHVLETHQLKKLLMESSNCLRRLPIARTLIKKYHCLAWGASLSRVTFKRCLFDWPTFTAHDFSKLHLWYCRGHISFLSHSDVPLDCWSLLQHVKANIHECASFINNSRHLHHSSGKKDDPMSLQFHVCHQRCRAQPTQSGFKLACSTECKFNWMKLFSVTHSWHRPQSACGCQHLHF